MQNNITTTTGQSVSVWSDASLNAAKWQDVPEEQRDRWTYVMLRGGLLQIARVLDVRRTDVCARLARSLRAAAAALVE